MKSTVILSVLVFFTGCIAVTIAASAYGQDRTKTLQPVEGVDINRYLGVWYEIARLPHRFEKDLVGVTATYTLKPNGKIEVLNQGYKGTLEGELKKAKGRARIPNPAQSGLLKVSFFLFFWADYKIIALDKENYEYALVTSSSKNYLWLLSRTPQLEDSTYNRLMTFAEEKGFDLSKVIKVQQPK
jgi:apolipoprotein D and lipocalin family protein